MIRTKSKNIDDVQPSTVDEHFKILLDDEEVIDYEISEELTDNDLPDWYDAELFERGQQYYASNMLGLSAASLAGLIAVLAIPSILSILIYTKQSGKPCTAFRRYLETILHARAWYTQNIKDKNSDWYRTTNTVRWKHGIASRKSRSDGLGGITQRDLALTQFGFIGYVLIHPKYLGLTDTQKEREGINHFWKVTGHMIGISDRLNICRKTAAETTELCRKLQAHVFRKYFDQRPPNFVEMTEAMLTGMWSIDVTTDKDALFAWTYQLNGLPYYKPLSLYSWLNLKYHEAVHFSCRIPYIGTAIRVWFNYILRFNYWLLGKWTVVGWLTFGRENCKLNMYPKRK